MIRRKIERQGLGGEVGSYHAKETNKHNHKLCVVVIADTGVEIIAMMIKAPLTKQHQCAQHNTHPSVPEAAK